MRTSSEISNLRSREPKAWKVIDQLMAESDRKKVPAAVKFAAAEFILSRLYPEKKVLEGIGPDGEIVIRVERAEVENNLQAPRFAVPDLQ